MFLYWYSLKPHLIPKLVQLGMLVEYVLVLKLDFSELRGLSVQDIAKTIFGKQTVRGKQSFRGLFDKSSKRVERLSDSFNNASSESVIQSSVQQPAERNENNEEPNDCVADECNICYELVSYS